MSETLDPNVIPSESPNRREALLVALSCPAPGHNTHDVVVYDIVRTGESVDLVLSGMTGTFNITLMDAFIKGFEF